MSNSTSNLDLLSATQASKETSANALFDAASPATLWGRRASSTASLTWGYYGGNYQAGTTSNAIANGTVTLTASTTNYVFADNVTGAVSVNSTGVPAGKIPLYTVVTNAVGATSYTDLRSYQPSAVGGTSTYVPAEQMMGGGIKTAAYTMVASDRGNVLVMNSSSAVSQPLPSATGSSGNFPNGWFGYAETIGSGAMTITVPSGASLDGVANGTVAAAQNQGLGFFTDGTNWFTIRGIGGSGGMTNPMTTLGDIITAAAAGAPQRLSVGSNGQVLTVVSGAPAWAAAGGGATALSGLSDVSVPAMNSTLVGPADGTNYSASTYAWKGNLLTPTQTCYVTSITSHFNAVSGVPLQAAIATATGGVLTSAPVFSAQVTPSTGGSADITFTFNSPVQLTSGTQYVFLVGASSQGPSWQLPVDSPTSGSWPTNSFCTMGTLARLAVTTPANGSAYDTNSNSTIPITMRIAFTTVNIAGQYLRNNGVAWANSTILPGDVPVFVGSGSTHAPGAVPDPGATAGSTRFLREDSTWSAIPLSGRQGAIDGNFDSWQVGTSFTLGSAVTQYTADMWIANTASGAAATVSQQVATLGSEPAGMTTPRRNKLRYAMTTAGGGYISQRKESVASYNGRSITVSAYQQALAAGTLVTGVTYIQNFGTGGSPSSSVTATTTVAWSVGTTEQRFSVRLDIPSITGKTLGTNGNDFLEIQLNLASGLTFTLDTSQIQFEESSPASPTNTTGAGGAPTAFEYLGKAVESQRVLRYVKVIASGGFGVVASGVNQSTTSSVVPVSLGEPMRVNPAITQSGMAINQAGSQLSISAVSGGATNDYQFMLLNCTVSGATNGSPVLLQAVSTGGSVTFDARL